jgi:formylglycine-generating enzyme required for sulfatase activity
MTTMHQRQGADEGHGTGRRDRDLQRYIDDAIRFQPRPPGPLAQPAAPPIRVAATLLTCGTAVAVFNGIGIPAEPESAYRHVNVHNPRCPLYFDRASGRWACVPGFETHPAWGINWAGARLVCQHLGARLPTEREWTCFASNNDPARIYPWGDAEPTAERANFGELIGGTSSVGSFPPSEIGLYDLAGNLSEWCEDVHPLPDADGDAKSFERVVKGGAWSKDAHHLRIATRRGKWERLGTTTIGIRPVWDD